jgi:hypothetical protein
MDTSGAAPQAKKRGPVFWILIGVASLVLLFVVVAGGIGYYAYRTVVASGVTPELMRSNPKFATHKLAVIMNKDLEIISEDQATDEITVRSKSTKATSIHKMNDDGKGFTMEPVEPTPETR